jgi:poly-gamma-glutamate synthesis protein (capsule biosynthesis protein)
MARTVQASARALVDGETMRAMRWRPAVAALVAIAISASSVAWAAEPTDPTGGAGTQRSAPQPAVRFPPTLPGRRTLVIAVSGDVLPHSPLWAIAAEHGRASGQAYDFRPMFTPVARLVAPAGLAICHLETPVAPPGEPLSTYPLYGVPTEITQAIASAGYDRCSTASNHSLDRRVQGVDATLAALEASGLGHTGTARSPSETRPVVFTVASIRVAHLSYTFSLNGLRLPAGEPWRANLLDPARIVADARAARAAGAEIVIVSLHWGAEYRTEPTAEQRAVAGQLTASGVVDLIVGHHAHVVQPIERQHGRWVLYGLGNHLSNMKGGGSLPAGTQDGLVAWVHFVERARGWFVAGPPVAWPTWVHPETRAITDVLGALADRTTPPATRGALEASLARTRAVVSAYVPTQ